MQQFKSIGIDLQVFKKIQENRTSFAQSENDILRELLGIEPVEAKILSNPGLNIGRGVFLPDGTKLRRRYKGRLYEVAVKDGRIVYNGKSYTSPSGAAVAITGSPVNGWRFWEVQKPKDDSYQLLANLRS